MAVFDKAAGFFDGHFRDLDVPFWRLVERRGDDFSFDAADHVGDFFGTLVDEKDDEDDFGMVRRDGIGDVLHDDRFARSRRGDDESALSFSDRRGEIEDARGHPFFGRLHHKRVSLDKAESSFQRGSGRVLFGGLVVDLVHFEQCEVFFFFFRRADGAVDSVAFFQIESADLRGGDINVFCGREVVVVGRAQEAKSIGKDFEDTFANEDFIPVFRRDI